MKRCGLPGWRDPREHGSPFHANGQHSLIHRGGFGYPGFHWDQILVHNHIWSGAGRKRSLRKAWFDHVQHDSKGTRTETMAHLPGLPSSYEQQLFSRLLKKELHGRFRNMSRVYCLDAAQLSSVDLGRSIYELPPGQLVDRDRAEMLKDFSISLHERDYAPFFCHLWIRRLHQTVPVQMSWYVGIIHLLGSGVQSQLTNQLNIFGARKNNE